MSFDIYRRGYWLTNDCNFFCPTPYEHDIFLLTDNLEEYLNGGYIEARGYDVLDFWGKVCKDWSIRDLMLHPYDPVTGRSCRKSVLNRKKKRSSLSTSSAGDPSKPSTSSSFANTGAKRLQALKERALEEMEAKPGMEAFLSSLLT